MGDKVEGKMKEAAGAMTGDGDLEAEGRAQQRKGATRDDAAQKERTRRAGAEAKETERERPKGKKPSGGLTDTLSGRQ